MQKIVPFLWFDGQAEEAAGFYVSLFRDAAITATRRFGSAGPGPAGKVMSVEFRLEGQDFIALNGGPHFHFTPAISLFVNCRDQEEVDALWERFSEGGSHPQCGWITDKFGLTWQIVPTILGQMLQDPDPARAARVMAAMMQMKKLDIAALRRAYEG